MAQGKAGVVPGRYRHYKGKEYQVIGVARHSETREELVVYRCLYGDYSLWVRPLTMFTESVMVEGRPVPRFASVSPHLQEEPGEPEPQPDSEEKRQG